MEIVSLACETNQYLMFINQIFFYCSYAFFCLGTRNTEVCYISKYNTKVD